MAGLQRTVEWLEWLHTYYLRYMPTPTMTPTTTTTPTL
jgi:hypothetical protein